MAGTAARVLPSPVFISAILPSWSTIAPSIWTSKWRSPSVRTLASRTTADASSISSSREAPSPRRARNSSVFARSSASDSACIRGSSAAMPAARVSITFIPRPSPKRRTLLMRSVLMASLAGGCGAVHRSNRPRADPSLEWGKRAPPAHPASRPSPGSALGLDEPVVAVAAPVADAHRAGVGVGEDVEAVLQHLQVQDRVLGGHGLHLEALGLYDAGPLRLVGIRVRPARRHLR